MKKLRICKFQTEKGALKYCADLKAVWPEYEFRPVPHPHAWPAYTVGMWVDPKRAYGHGACNAYVYRRPTPAEGGLPALGYRHEGK